MIINLRWLPRSEKAPLAPWPATAKGNLPGERPQKRANFGKENLSKQNANKQYSDGWPDRTIVKAKQLPLNLRCLHENC